MKKRSSSSHGSDKSQEPQPKKQKKLFQFQYNKLQCFISSESKKPQIKTPPTSSKNTQLQILISTQITKEKQQQKTPLSQLRIPRKNKGKITSNSHQAFNNKLLLLEYENHDDSKHENNSSSSQKRDEPKNEEQDQVVNDIVNSCMRVITEDTQHSSNPISARYTPRVNTQPDINKINPIYPNMPIMMQMIPEEYYYYMMKSPGPVRNRRAISTQESKDFFIDLKKIQVDGRTTIMVRNIPNKYTQDMLLELFQKNHKKKFDFFYLPIDYNNNCNVGYAFLNFIHTKFINQFYLEFHRRKWNKFNSTKVCEICYARIQGTAQLENHFQHSNVIQQRQRRFRPLIGIKSLSGNISNLVQQQQSQFSSDQSEEN